MSKRGGESVQELARADLPVVAILDAESVLAHVGFGRVASRNLGFNCTGQRSILRRYFQDLDFRVGLVNEAQLDSQVPKGISTKWGTFFPGDGIPSQILVESSSSGNGHPSYFGRPMWREIGAGPPRALAAD
jgi:hypothetical protein